MIANKSKYEEKQKKHPQIKQEIHQDSGEIPPAFGFGSCNLEFMGTAV